MRASTLLLILCASVLATACSPVSVSDLPASTAPRPASLQAPTSTAVPATLTMTPGPVTASPTPSPVPTETPFITPPAPGQAALIPILMYHHLQLLGPSASMTERTWTVSPQAFESQLDYLAGHGYRTVSFAQLIGFLEKGKPLPPHPVLITFDDGWMEDYTVAFPALRKRGMVATFFVPITYADAGGKALIGWPQITEMDAAGMEFGSHTLNHANLREVSPQEAMRQLTLSKSKLERKLGHSTFAFSYPFGAASAQVEGWVRQAGYQAAVGLCCGYKIRDSDLLLLPRIRVSYEDTLEDLAKKLPPAGGI